MKDSDDKVDGIAKEPQVKKQKIMHDERDEAITTKAESYASHIMITFAEIAFVISLFKGLDAAWGFFSIMMSGATTLMLYKYTKENDKHFKPFLYASIVFGVVAIGSLVKFAVV